MTIISHKHKFIFVRQRKVAGSSIILALRDVLGENDYTHVGKFKYRPHWDETKYTQVKDSKTHRGVFDDGDPYDVCGHRTIPELMEMVSEDIWNSYFKFTVVRNPWDWFISLYVFHMKGISPYTKNTKKIKARLGLLLQMPWTIEKSVFHTRYIRDYLKERRSIYSHIVKNFNAGRHPQAIENILMSDCLPRHILPQSEDFYFYENEPVLDYYIRYEDLDNGFRQVCDRINLSDIGNLPRAKTKIRDEFTRNYQACYTPKTKQRIAEYFPQTIKHFNYTFD